MTRISRHILAVLMLMLLTPLAHAQDKIALKLNLTKGQKFVQTMETEQKITQEVPGLGKQVIDQTMGFTMSNNVIDVDDKGIATVEMVYDAVKFSQSTVQGKVSYDSTKDKEAPAAAKTFAAMVGAKLTTKMDRQGKVTEVKGADDLMKRVLEATAIPPGPQGDLVKNQMKAQFGDAAMKQQVENLSAIFPDSPVGVGDTWKKVFEMNTGMPLAVETVYTYKGSKEGTAAVDAAAKVSTPANAKPMEMGPMKIVIALAGKQGGTLQIDEKTGLTTSSDVDQDISGTTTVQDAEGNQIAKMPMTIVSKVKVRTVGK